MGDFRGRALSILLERLRAQLLCGGPAPDPVAVAERLLAVQGQDARGVRLAIRARTSGLAAADVDRALTEERTLLITWLNRGTLHLVRSEDYHWLHAVTTPPMMKPLTSRLAQLGVGERAGERGLKVIERALANDGPLTRAQLGERLDAAGIPTKGQALIHVLCLATMHGLTVRGPMVGKQHAYALVRDWLGPPPKPVARDVALGELVRRYLAGHAPAGERDLARWARLPLRDVRVGLEAVSSRIRERDDGLLELRAGDAEARLAADGPPPRLLGAFDPLLLGWRSRAPVTGDHERSIVAGGMFRPFALVGGRAAATWKIDRRAVVLEPVGWLRRADARALRADGKDVIRYLGL